MSGHRNCTMRSNVSSSRWSANGDRLSEMTRSQKQTAVRRLDEYGAFLFRGAVEDVLTWMGVSKVTLYSYLNAIDEAAQDEALSGEAEPNVKDRSIGLACCRKTIRWVSLECRAPTGIEVVRGSSRTQFGLTNC